MPYVLGLFRVKDFEAWRAGFVAEESVAWRKSDGAGKYRIFRAQDDPSTALVLLEWDNLDNARRHAQSAKLREIHENILTAPPEVYFLEADEDGPAW